MPASRGQFLKSAEEFARHPWRLAAAVLLAALSLTSVYRAYTQSITHDEAVMFEWYLTGSWGQVLNVAHGNHHVVTDLLSKLAITLFGLSELTLRIPALLGGLVYFYSVFRISECLLGVRFRFLLSVALLGLNPFVLDYFSLARGYGAALGCFFYALYQVVLYLAPPPEGEPPRRLLHKGGGALGVSIGCNAVMIFPGGALIASLLALLAGDAWMRKPEPVEAAPADEKSRGAKKGRRRKSRHEVPRGPRARGWEAMIHFVFPAAAVAGFILMLPSRLIDIEEGNLGPASLFEILEGLVRNSFFHSPTGFAGLASWFPAESAIRILTQFAVPVCVAGLIAAAVGIAFSWTAKGNLEALPAIDRIGLLLGAMLPVTLVLILVSRYVFLQPYPELRTAMYWIPLLGLASMSLLDRFGRGSGIVTAVLVLCVVQFMTQFNTRYFAEWAYCAAGKDMMQIIRAGTESKRGVRVRIGATWQLEPVINFYRAAWRLDWIDPVRRESPNNVYDYYVLLYGDTALVERLHLKKLLSDPLSGAVLAKRGD